jgi:hypothetical protein
MPVAEWIVLLSAAYAVLGLLFAGPFLVRGVTRLDPAARGTSLAFRLAILPGTVALWPVLARKWAGGTP